jgi:UDP-N-acetylmuramoyl-tripeptide--D-alanyl-D-alanine ligase
MIAAALKRAEDIVGSVGVTNNNLNDDVGLPLTVLRFSDWPDRIRLLFKAPYRAMRFILHPELYPKILVLEFATYSGGHLDRLAKLAPPNIGVVTVIGPVHLEKLKTVEGVAREKSAVISAVSPEGLVILGEDHDHVGFLESTTRAPVVKVPGRGPELSERVTRIICRHLRVPDQIVDTALAEYQRPKGRLNCLEFDTMTVIDDSYNANPLSMKLGLDTLAETASPTGRRLAVLGYMAELGEGAPAYHREIGDYARNKADLLIGVGELARNYNPDHWYESSAACSRDIERLLRTGDCVLVKGSASAGMKTVAERLVEIAEQPGR